MKPPFDLQTCWPPELRLVVAASSRPFDAGLANTLIAAGVDWERVLALASDHGLAPLLHAHLSSLDSVPEEVSRALHAASYVNITAALRLTAELSRVSTVLRQASVPFVSYKGPTLAQRLYGNVSLRCYSDLDLLVDRADRERAAATLRERGYLPRHPIHDRRRQELGDCEEQYNSPDGRTVIDLHWEIAQPYLSIGPLPAGWRDRTCTEMIAGEAVPCFAARDELLVLAIHGGKHQWDSLSWVADFAAMLSLEPVDWPALEQAAERMRARYHLLLAVTLAHCCYRAEVPDTILIAAEKARVPWRYAAAIARSYASAPETRSLADRWTYHFRMRERWSDRARAAFRFVLRPGSIELEHSALPGYGAFLYPAVRASRLATRAVKAAASSAAGRPGPGGPPL